MNAPFKGSIVITVPNVNVALTDGLWKMHLMGEREDSRNGPVIVMPGPVLTEYLKPQERVLFSPDRDANPFFHFMEALWMLGGHNEVGKLTAYNAGMARYSDDGEHLHGAYGFRWREWFSFDQLEALIAHLHADPKSRRAVLAMWSPSGDLVASEGVGGVGSKDLPCNTHCYVDLRGGKLNLTVLCRSNDMLWGAYGANQVHFGFLQEYLAMHLGARLGVLRQFSNNFHLYPAVFTTERLDRMRHDLHDPYGVHVTPLPLLQRGEDPQAWDRDLRHFWLEEHSSKFYTVFFADAAWTLRMAWRKHKAGDQRNAIALAESCAAADWGRACVEWLERRYAAKAAA